MKIFPEVTFVRIIPILYFHHTEPLWKDKLSYNAHTTEDNTSSACIFFMCPSLSYSLTQV